MSVQVSSILSHLQAADLNRDGKFTKKEIANAAIGNTNEQRPIVAGSPEYSVLYTMAAGGKDGLGLFPDADNDGAVTANELQGLAAKDGQADSFTPQDFSLGFGNRAGAATVDTATSFKKLEGIAGTDFAGQAQNQVNQQFPDLKQDTANLFNDSMSQIGQLSQGFEGNPIMQLFTGFMGMMMNMMQMLMGGQGNYQ